jgi:hypothetical protein
MDIDSRHEYGEFALKGVGGGILSSPSSHKSLNLEKTTITVLIFSSGKTKDRINRGFF